MQAGGAGPGDGGLVVNGIADGDDRAHAWEHLEAIAAMAGDWALALLDKVPSPSFLTILCRAGFTSRHTVPHSHVIA